MAVTLVMMILFLGTEVFARENITGYWYYTEKKGTSVSKVYKSGGQYEAFCFGYTNAGVTQEEDRGNPDKSKRKRSMYGIIFLYGLSQSVKNGANLWKGGLLYNPRDGRTYNVKASLSDSGNTLNVRVSLDEQGIVGVTLQWRRVNDPATIARYDRGTASINPVYPLK